MDGVIRVSPESVLSYGQRAQECLDQIQKNLQSLVDEVVNVNYHGENAYSLKSKLGDTAVAYADALRSDMGKIAEAVRTATSAITQALGGTSINLTVTSAGFTKPSVQAPDGNYQADPTALEQLDGSIRSRVASIVSGFDSHLTALTATDWESKSKETAVAQVRTFTTDAQTKTQELETNLTKAISDQVAALRRADGVG